MVSEDDERRRAFARAELVDLGCGTGSDLTSLERRFGATAIGIDRNRRKIARGRESGRAVFQGDITELDHSLFESARFAVLDNVLEHLPSMEVVEAVLASACSLASEVVCIRHPSFDHVEYLRANGLKQYWTDWPRSHPTPIELHELMAIANRVGAYRTIVQPVMRALDSSDPTLLPLAAPSEQHRRDRSRYGVYDPERHGPKPEVVFDRPVYFAFDIALVTGGDMPAFSYRDDPETSVRRPRLVSASARDRSERRVGRRHDRLAALRHRVGRR